MQWEYKLVLMTKQQFLVEKELNELGAQGFHLIATIQPTTESFPSVILERGVNPEWDKVATEAKQEKTQTKIISNPDLRAILSLCHPEACWFDKSGQWFPLAQKLVLDGLLIVTHESGYGNWFGLTDIGKQILKKLEKAADASPVLGADWEG
jgi:hypothetical protein